MEAIYKLAISLRINILIILCFWALTTTLLYVSVDDVNGLVKLAIVWIPSIVTVITVCLYYLSRLIIRKYSWIISLIGIIIMLYVSIPVFFGLDN
ncbi:hypothetical protein [Dokdonia sp. Hel_I_53]|uniref:hypothetical protein n=1 Tax=Dokdonia sp. Hel_I_53 TaxID=1566287 RepID=UPI00119A4C99|nr:hypothetical protein [Dokdonia sp. Hel_I_53]TVZ51599.1 hypothetical protein OD90_0747 [Dokdonia sp. Hel_I_53]